MRALDLKLLRDLSRMRGQAIAVAVVVACGVMAFVTARSAYDSLMASHREYYRSYRFADVFAGLKRAPERVARAIRAIPGADVVETRVVMDVTIDVPGLEEPATGRLVSIPERGEPLLNALHLRSGRLPGAGRRGEALVSEAFAEANRLTPGDGVGAIINGRWERLRVVGIALSPEYVYAIRGVGTVLPDRRRFGIFWMRRDVLGPAFDMDGAFNDVALRLAPGAREADVIARLDAVLEPWGGLGAYGREDQLSHGFIDNELHELRAWGRLMPAIFLGSAAFLLHIVLTRLVSIQREQIGVLKAFGYSNAMLGMHYLMLVVVLAAAGSAVGSVAGLWTGSAMTTMYAEFFRFPVMRHDTRAQVVLLGVAVTTAAAVVGALGAVRRAVRIPPAEAMRPEPPVPYRAGWLDRAGATRVLSPASRIVVRSLVRRPARTALSVLMIALAVGLLVLGGFFKDAIDAIVDLQFRQVQREDVSVGFSEPRPGRIVHELASLDGVRRVETFRSVPARLVAGHRRARTGLLGMAADPELRRPVDMRGRVVRIPPQGAALSSHLARRLEVGPGDIVRVEVLEGARPVREVPVAAVVDDVMGETVYMDAGALARLMREQDAVSGAFLSVAEPRRRALFARLMEAPAVSAVALRETVIESYEETIGRTFGVFNAFLVALSAALAIAMVYNGARIALSERSTELASLRVLGFSRQEVFGMLLAEQAFIIAIAVPTGFALARWACTAIVGYYDTELFRLPLVITGRTYALAFLVVVAAAAASALIVRGRVDRLDLIAALKARE